MDLDLFISSWSALSSNQCSLLSPTPLPFLIPASNFQPNTRSIYSQETSSPPPNTNFPFSSSSSSSSSSPPSSSGEPLHPQPNPTQNNTSSFPSTPSSKSFVNLVKTVNTEASAFISHGVNLGCE
ncbi:hypothetical protein MLD38_033359 [Melastoma candidum]|uniref:Uncharacterized protein n=1 Tax=Melastoma candidum TaxID=119954 RepID=A0ACB9M8S5_9MYRT|nr:hypothetical protein MLD38_033359 [Melastoma candidum]